MFDFLKKDKLPRGARKAIAPDVEFVKKAKGRFLATFDAHYSTARPAHRFTLATKTALIALILVGATAGATVYADTNNVPVSSPLYPLKRLGENVQLTLATPAAKPELEATFAVRRATEIDDLEKTHPTSSLIAGLNEDLDNDVNTSVASAGQSDLCGRVVSMFSVSSSAMRQELSSHARIFARVEAQCGIPIAVTTGTIFRAGPVASKILNTTSTVSATATAHIIIPNIMAITATTTISGKPTTTRPTSTEPGITGAPIHPVLPGNPLLHGSFR